MSLRNSELANQAVDDVLLAHGADLSNAAVLNYYVDNPTQFAIDCVSDIATATQAQAAAIVVKLKAGASFSQEATSSSVDSQTAASGGALGCDYTEARVLQALQLPSVTVGQPVTPIETSSGTWVIYEVTSQTQEPVTSAVAVIRQELLQSTSNVQRVTRELLAYAHRASISVNPQYGTWSGVKVTPPSPPATRYLLPTYASTSAGSGSTASTGSTPSTGSTGSTSSTGSTASTGSTSG